MTKIKRDRNLITSKFFLQFLSLLLTDLVVLKDQLQTGSTEKFWTSLTHVDEYTWLLIQVKYDTM
jgi:hypothetical protein